MSGELSEVRTTVSVEATRHVPGRPQLAGHWRRGAKDYGWYHGEPGKVVVEVWWPLSDPSPEGVLWP